MELFRQTNIEKGDLKSPFSFTKERFKMLKNKWIWAGVVIVVAIVLWQSGIFAPDVPVTTG